jgi:hypothetical protein
MVRITLLALWFVAAMAYGQTERSLEVGRLVTVSAPVFVLNHIRVVDGTGAPASEDQAVVVEDGKIRSIGPSTSLEVPSGAQLLDRTGYTVIPGLVGMHNHLYYNSSSSVQVSASGELSEPGFVITPMPFSAPRLYLAAGVTTMRTTGSIEP